MQPAAVVQVVQAPLDIGAVLNEHIMMHAV
jgi:hypothetical protein